MNDYEKGGYIEGGKVIIGRPSDYNMVVDTVGKRVNLQTRNSPLRRNITVTYSP